MADCKYYAYCLVGFGSYLDWKIVEFLERLPDTLVCNGCGIVSANSAVLPCMHVSCLHCNESKCVVDKRNHCGKMTAIQTTVAELLSKQVRCLCSSEGCEYIGTLDRLGYHYPRRCDFARIVCSCCGARIPFKQLAGHYVACQTAANFVIATSAKVKRLLEDLSNAKKELEVAVASGSKDDSLPRASVTSMLEAVERLNAELGDCATKSSEDAA